MVPLLRYWNPNIPDHLYATDPDEIGVAIWGLLGRHGYWSEAHEGFIYTYQAEGTVPLYRYVNINNKDHLYATNAFEIKTITPGVVGKFGYKSEGIVGFCHPRQVAGTVPLFR